MQAASLRSKVLRGGAYLAVRQALGTVIAIAGILAVTRLIGPAQYGLYAGSIGIFIVAQMIAQLGINLFIVRSEQPADATTLGTATTLALGLGILITLLLAAMLPLIENVTRLTGIQPIALSVFLTLPITQLTVVPQALLERALDFRRVAAAELVSQITYFGAAVAIALIRPTALALAIGWLLQQMMLCVLMHRAAKRVPSFGWNSAVAHDIVTSGVAYTTSTGLFQLRRLVNPIVVGRYLGTEAVGIVGVTSQIVANLSFIGIATWRLAAATFARLQEDRRRLGRALEEGMLLQVFAVAPFMLLFAMLGSLLVPSLMGPRWNAVVLLFPFLAAVSLTTAVFNLHASTLYVLKQNWAMSSYHVAHSCVLAAAALLLVPSLGLTGYGLAELATIVTFWILHDRTVRHVAPLAYGKVAVLLVAVSPALFFLWTGWWSLVPLLAAVAIVKPWQRYRAIFSQMRAVVYES